MMKTRSIALSVVLSAVIINVAFAGSVFGGDDKPEKKAPAKGKGKKAYASGYASGYESGKKVYASGEAAPFSSTAAPVLSETDVHEIVKEGDWNPAPQKVVLPLDEDADKIVPEKESYAAYLRANKK
jgi:hypothetical protein